MCIPIPLVMMSNAMSISIMKNSMRKKRYETPETELLVLVMEDFLQYTQIPGGEEEDDGEYD